MAAADKPLWRGWVRVTPGSWKLLAEGSDRDYVDMLTENHVQRHDREYVVLAASEEPQGK